MRHIILGIVLLTVLFEGYGAKTFVGKVSGIESKEPFIAPKMAPPRFSKNSFNVKDFGAKGDSTTNESVKEGASLKSFLKPAIKDSVYINEKNEVIALFTTCLPSNGPARIIIQPVDKYYPKN